jgi:hypothetical protein
MKQKKATRGEAPSNVRKITFGGALPRRRPFLDGCTIKAWAEIP